MDRHMLKKSGIGRAVMLLFKHPKELSDNKKVAGKIISMFTISLLHNSKRYYNFSHRKSPKASMNLLYFDPVTVINVKFEPKAIL